MNIAICEDNWEQLVDLQQRIEKILNYESYTIKTFQNSDILIMDIQERLFNYDIIFLDIMLGDINGIEIARRINEVYPLCDIIFVTGFMKYALEVYSTEHVYYILKSKLDEKLPLAIKKVKDKLVKRKNTILTVETKGIFYKLRQIDIIYIERVLHATYIHLAESSDVVITSEKLKDIEKRLAPDDFVRCHTSFIINREHIKILKNNEIQLYHYNQFIPVSRAYLSNVRLMIGKVEDHF